jgi:hypothetical protein
VQAVVQLLAATAEREQHPQFLDRRFAEAVAVEVVLLLTLPELQLAAEPMAVEMELLQPMQPQTWVVAVAVAMVRGEEVETARLAVAVSSSSKRLTTLAQCFLAAL